jgi:uncharacterized protein
MKPSKYNFVFPLDGGMYLIYNAVSGGFAKIDKQTLDLIKMSNHEPLEPSASVLENLKKGKFVVEDDFDEIGYLKVMMNTHRFTSNSFALTIAPTLQCNFNCTYCYENHVPVTMGPDTIKAVNQFIQTSLKSIHALAITWFGGEPLLAMGIIRTITQNILNTYTDPEFHFYAGMITNGYMLTRKVAEELPQLHVKGVQVTIDGPPDVHDKRRILANGKGTFHQILDNVVNAADILSVSIRMNIDKANVDRAPEVLDILKERGVAQKVNVYFAPVLNVGNLCRDVAASCLEYKTYSRHEIALYREAVEKGFDITKYPRPFRGYCGAVSLNSLLIDPYGNFHKCWNTIGIEAEAVGKIGEPLPMGSTLVKWLSWDPFENKDCVSCTYLPICMGGCPYLRRTRSVNCSPWRYNLEEMLRLYYTKRADSALP